MRGYMEISQRVDVLNQRYNIISDLLDMLRDHINKRQGEKLEKIIIALIFLEVLIGMVTICFDFVKP